MSNDNRHGRVVRPQLCSLHTTEQQAAYHHTTKHRQHRLGVFSELDGCRLDAQAQVVQLILYTKQKLFNWIRSGWGVNWKPRFNTFRSYHYAVKRAQYYSSTTISSSKVETVARLVANGELRLKSESVTPCLHAVGSCVCFLAINIYMRGFESSLGRLGIRAMRWLWANTCCQLTHGLLVIIQQWCISWDYYSLSFWLGASRWLHRDRKCLTNILDWLKPNPNLLKGLIWYCIYNKQLLSQLSES